ncbi:MAG TPA: hypothetical protein VMR18_02380 [Candidatus Saccharimonadales bacterium]|nr:hypothetical protein [Candidatus Saccharimonadales bacterium]
MNNQNLKPFRQGEDPRRNTKGRPKGSISLSSWIQKLLNDGEFTALVAHPIKGYVEFKGAPIKAIIQTAIIKAMSGDMRAADWLARYGYGNSVNIETSEKTLPIPIMFGMSSMGGGNREEIIDRFYKYLDKVEDI